MIFAHVEAKLNTQKLKKYCCNKMHTRTPQGLTPCFLWKWNDTSDIFLKIHADLEKNLNSTFKNKNPWLFNSSEILRN